MCVFVLKTGVTNKSHLLLSRKRLWDSRWLLLKILCRAPLRLAKLAVDEAYLGRGEGAAAQLAQVAERGLLQNKIDKNE